MMNSVRLLCRRLCMFSLAIGLATGPAFACDPDDLWREVKATCIDFVTAANQHVARLWPLLGETERRHTEDLVRAAWTACDDDALAGAAQLTARLAIHVGRLEARHGLPAADTLK